VLKDGRSRQAPMNAHSSERSLPLVTKFKILSRSTR
jgi:hypothetical protein